MMLLKGRCRCMRCGWGLNLRGGRFVETTGQKKGIWLVVLMRLMNMYLLRKEGSMELIKVDLVSNRLLTPKVSFRMS